MEKNDQVNIQELREVVNRILDFIEKDLGHSEVELKNNFYWSIDDNVLYSMENRPEQLDCGSLVDDWGFVISAFNNPDQALPLTLLHVAPLLRALAVTLPSYKSLDEKAK